MSCRETHTQDKLALAQSRSAGTSMISISTLSQALESTDQRMLRLCSEYLSDATEDHRFRWNALKAELDRDVCDGVVIDNYKSTKIVINKGKPSDVVQWVINHCKETVPSDINTKPLEDGICQVLHKMEPTQKAATTTDETGTSSQKKDWDFGHYYGWLMLAIGVGGASAPDNLSKQLQSAPQELCFLSTNIMEDCGDMFHGTITTVNLEMTTTLPSSYLNRLRAIP
ncbi:hypothetical protein WOLCODRAFT_18682 [Wolfiporia cocos MD-104 SS10]|uniref:Uncharacterized protein n=1 Tax=Wolfiporia cocos (strain MD-104) TaxID=742152 RepID=A0A2H3JR56_WOLCO|nr:hypothetical protein WOLCODRAFT_18682 [Wolfiporia cocos MD-104 SS10]